MAEQADRVSALADDVSYLQQDMAKIGMLVDRLDITIDKLAEVSTSLSQLLAVHETKISAQDAIVKSVSDLVEKRREEMEEYGASVKQQNAVLSILELLDERRERMNSLQKDIESIESKMRAINLKPGHVAGQPLNNTEKVLLAKYGKQIEMKRQQLTELRDYYQMALFRHDLGLVILT